VLLDWSDVLGSIRLPEYFDASPADAHQPGSGRQPNGYRHWRGLDHDINMYLKAFQIPASGNGSTNCDNGWVACRLPSVCYPSSLLCPWTRRRLTGPCQRSRLHAVLSVVRPCNGCNGSGPAVGVLLDLDSVAFPYSSMGAEQGCRRGGLHIATRMPNLVGHA